MTRIIGGVARGHRLIVPTANTRPTSDRIREALFSSLNSWLAQDGRSWIQISFADLFAGSGAIGLEAASRGATHVVLIERDREALKVMEGNALRTGLHVAIERSDVSQWSPDHAFDIFFLDPPYVLPDLDVAMIVRRLTSQVISLPRAHSSMFVVERGGRSSDPFVECEPDFINEKWDRTYGDTRLWYGLLVGGVE